jgi:hypothetical protein
MIFEELLCSSNPNSAILSMNMVACLQDFYSKKLSYIYSVKILQLVSLQWQQIHAVFQLSLVQLFGLSKLIAST